MHRHPLIALVVALGLTSPPARACTNFLITKGASTDGSTMISYSADSHVMYGELYHMPGRVHPKGAMRRIIDWDSGKYIGKIKEARRTYLVVGNINEHQVAIGETTYKGRKELINPKGGIDYGSLMYVALQRSKTAREAIKVMTSLVDEYGYRSSGESFSISDPNEVWIMEMIGKGPGRKGAVWVARKIPDGYISAHANQARIHKFPLADPNNCLYAKDVITFAREKGYFKGKDKDFSFADAYSPLDYRKLRICEARVWSMFRRAAPSLKLPVADYVLVKDGARPKTLPLWIKPDRKLSIKDVIGFMRDHFEGTTLDLSRGVGAGPYRLPYRWRPLTWKVDGTTHLNERATSTQQTGFSFVSQSRSWLPGPIGGVLWFSVDDSASTVYIPIYCGIRRVPKSYAEKTASFEKFSWGSAFWVFNFVANLAYSRYSDKIKVIQKVQQQLEDRFFADQARIERAALRLHRRSPDAARRYLTRYSVKTGEMTTDRWRKLGEQLVVKFLDGNVRDDKGKVTHPGYPEAWYRRIVEESREHFRVRRLAGEPAPEKKKGKKRAGKRGKKGQKGEWWNLGAPCPCRKSRP